MNYKNSILARFIARDNRFVARAQLLDGQEVVVHVKNTGRGKEILLPGAWVSLEYCPNSKRKTAYDLVAVKKQDQWINIDSQLPNLLAYEGLLHKEIILPKQEGELSFVKREVSFEHSRFDLYYETTKGQKGFVEVKGLTLENQGIGAFPDAPTLRGEKHVLELIDSQKEGFTSYILFIVQFEHIHLATIHHQMQPSLTKAIASAQQAGVEVLAYNCRVSAGEVTLKNRVPFDLAYPFVDPNQP